MWWKVGRGAPMANAITQSTRCLAGDTKLVDGNWALWPLKRDIVGTIDGQDYQFHSPVKRHKVTERSWWKQPASVCSDRSLAKS